MDNASLTVSLAMIAGVLAQSAAVHLRVPGIVLLLAVGVLLGPDGVDVVRPHILGGGLQAFVGFAVAIILFEGGLSMNLRRLSRQVVPIRRLVTIGAIVTAVGAAIAARLLMSDWSWRLAILFGTLVIVTGPTVITPLIRRMSLRKNLATILEAEGIFIDAIGATIAVVALEAALAWTAMSAAAGVLDVALRIGVGAFVGLGGGAFLAVLIRWRHVVPEGLENILALSVAVATFQVSNSLVHESGITAAIVAGMVISNTESHAFEEIVEFKEQLTHFFVATLFVLLAADVRVANVIALGWPGLWTVLALMVVVRPLCVVLSTWGTDLTWRDRLFLSWLAPRGIVAAAVASLFAIRLAESGVAGGVEMRALVFLVIAMTVTVQGLTGGLLASLLGLRRATNVGYLILGANVLARRLGNALRRQGNSVTLIDSNVDACRVAERQGFDVIYGNGLEPMVLARAHAGTRRACVGLTPNESVNFLFARRVRESFKGVDVYVGLVKEASGVTMEMAVKAQAEVLFGSERTMSMWMHLLESEQLLEEQWELEFPPDDPVEFGAAPKSALIPLVGVRHEESFLISAALRMKKGDGLVVLIRPEQREQAYEWLRNTGFVPAREAHEASEA